MWWNKYFEYFCGEANLPREREISNYSWIGDYTKRCLLIEYFLEKLSYSLLSTYMTWWYLNSCSQGQKRFENRKVYRWNDLLKQILIRHVITKQQGISGYLVLWKIYSNGFFEKSSNSNFSEKVYPRFEIKSILKILHSKRSSKTFA